MTKVPCISVIICTHNPRIQYLHQVLDRLRAQSQPSGDWELIIVDNDSARPVVQLVDIGWHPQSRVVRESSLGLTHARIRGIREASADILCFVDDDNLLDSDYLRRALVLTEKYPAIGAFGGSIRPNFETDPPNWLDPYREMLALRDVTRELWTNAREAPFNPPCGAGLVVRTVVAKEYERQLELVTWRKSLDRRGTNLISGGDTDLVLTACDIGYGWGVFPELTLEHLIPSERLEWQYMMKLLTGITASVTVLRAKHGHAVGGFNTLERYARWIANRIVRGKRAADHFMAVERGRLEGKRILARLGTPPAP